MIAPTTAPPRRPRPFGRGRFCVAGGGGRRKVRQGGTALARVDSGVDAGAATETHPALADPTTG